MENKRELLIVTESPHVRAHISTKSVMLDVIIALIPTLIAGTFIFGPRAAVLAAVCVISAVFFEWAFCRLIKKPNPIGDLSAAVTGLILALNLPVTMPYGMAIIGTLFAIVVVKQFFGGIGHNFMNPAMAARAFLLTSWAQAMTTWTKPFEKVNMLSNVDAVSSATPLANMASGELSALPTLLDMFLGKIGGSIGEVSALAVLIGAAYLLIRKIISIRIPAAYIITFSVIVFVFGGRNGFFTGDVLFHLFAGGILFGAFFMATDYVTTPYTKSGQIIFGIGCGVLTAVIRLWGGYPEGVTYSVLIMNVAAPLIDKYTTPKAFGEVKGKGAKQNA